MKPCKTGATYVISYKKGEKTKEHVFSCGKHLGELVRSSKVTVQDLHDDMTRLLSRV